MPPSKTKKTKKFTKKLWNVSTESIKVSEASNMNNQSVNIFCT